MRASDLPEPGSDIIFGYSLSNKYCREKAEKLLIGLGHHKPTPEEYSCYCDDCFWKVWTWMREVDKVTEDLLGQFEKYRELLKQMGVNLHKLGTEE